MALCADFGAFLGTLVCGPYWPIYHEFDPDKGSKAPGQIGLIDDFFGGC